MQLAGGDLNVADVAELPELLRSARVLKQHLVGAERVQFTAAKRSIASATCATSSASFASW